MLYFGLPYYDCDHRLAESYVTRPIGIFESLRATSNSLIGTFSSNLDRMLDTVLIPANDSARSKWHPEGGACSPSFAIRPAKSRFFKIR
jgi:hypothetical protein